jgi:hypothetical protein
MQTPKQHLVESEDLTGAELQEKSAPQTLPPKALQVAPAPERTAE